MNYGVMIAIYILWIIGFAEYGADLTLEGKTAFGWYSFACDLLAPFYPIRIYDRITGALPNDWGAYADYTFVSVWGWFLFAAARDMNPFTPADLISYCLPAAFYASGPAGLLSLPAVFSSVVPRSAGTEPTAKPAMPYSEMKEQDDDFGFDEERFKR